MSAFFLPGPPSVPSPLSAGHQSLGLGPTLLHVTSSYLDYIRKSLFSKKATFTGSRRIF